MQKPKTTLKDISDALGISISTVSRALKGNTRISADTRTKVMELAQKMDYQSIEVLQAQESEKPNLVGVIVPQIKYHLYAMAISGIESVLESRGFHLVVCQSNESYAREKNLVQELSKIGVRGIIISLASETQDFSHFEAIKESHIPLVFFNRECQSIETSKVIIDNEKAAYDAVNHLIDIGCTKIAYLGGPETLQINRSRILGYQQALADRGITALDKHLVYSKFDKESALSAARQLLYAPDHPDGILAFSDQLAINIMLAAKECGISIPEQLSVIGFNNEPVDELLEPSLTSISQPAFQIGVESANLLLAQHDTPNDPFQSKVLQSHLVIRNSTNKNRSQ